MGEVSRMASIPQGAELFVEADVGRLQLALPAHAIGARLQRDRRVLLVLQACGRALHLHMRNVEPGRDLARQRVVAIQRDRTEDAVMMPGRLAGSDDRRSCRRRIEGRGPTRGRRRRARSGCRPVRTDGSWPRTSLCGDLRRSGGDARSRFPLAACGLRPARRTRSRGCPCDARWSARSGAVGSLAAFFAWLRATACDVMKDSMFQLLA